jgi:hypothetical protein
MLAPTMASELAQEERIQFAIAAMKDGTSGKRPPSKNSQSEDTVQVSTMTLNEAALGRHTFMYYCNCSCFCLIDGADVE